MEDAVSSAPHMRAPVSRKRAGPRRRATGFRSLAGRTSLAVLCALVVLAVVTPYLPLHNPASIVGPGLLWPGVDAAFPLGTDALGRDVLSGLMHGSRVTLLVGVLAAVSSLLLGGAVGALAGYRGGWTDDLLQRVTEVFQTLPDFVLVIVLVAILEPSPLTVIVAIAVVRWPTIARLTRAEFRSLRDVDFVQAARGAGIAPWRIVLFEILPNAAPTLIATTSTLVASAILTESALSFMGLGDPNLTSWGGMIGSSRELLRTAWYLTLLPGIGITITVLAVCFAADALNDALNPRRAGGVAANLTEIDHAH